MMSRQQGLIVLVTVAVTVAWGQAHAAPTAAQVCEAAKLVAAGKMEQCLAAERAKEVKGQVPKYQKCSDDFAKALTKAEVKAGPGVCPTEGDTAAIETLIESYFADLSAALSGTPLPPSPVEAFPATGQTRCWNSAGTVIACSGTGHDGDIQAGATLSYTDNGDGTITDDNTLLTWEKKSDDGSVHDKDTLYTWANAFAQHIAALNTAPCFAGHCDWRLPNVRELQSIVHYDNANPSVSPAFNTGCAPTCTVLSCSCTAIGPSAYFSSSTYVFLPNHAWSVDFIFGGVAPNFKTGTFPVRAVRGGS